MKIERRLCLTFKPDITLLGIVVAVLLLVIGCSDIGTDPWMGWDEYDLPYAQIYLPQSFKRQQTVGVGPQNPTWAGVEQNERLLVEFCLYSQPSRWQWIEYEEEVVVLHGRPAVIFYGRGLLHPYDSSFQPLIGIRACFNPTGDSVVVIIKAQDTRGYTIARQILLSLHPQPANTGGLVEAGKVEYRCLTLTSHFLS